MSHAVRLHRGDRLTRPIRVSKYTRPPRWVLLDQWKSPSAVVNDIMETWDLVSGDDAAVAGLRELLWSLDEDDPERALKHVRRIRAAAVRRSDLRDKVTARVDEPVARLRELDAADERTLRDHRAQVLEDLGASPEPRGIKRLLRRRDSDEAAVSRAVSELDRDSEVLRSLLDEYDSNGSRATSDDSR